MSNRLTEGSQMTGSRAALSISCICVPPSIGVCHKAILLRSRLWYTTHFPSGAQSGLTSLRPRVSCVALPPSRSIRQILKAPARLDSKTIKRPPGETAGQRSTLHQFIFAHHLATVFDQGEQRLEGLRPERHGA